MSEGRRLLLFCVVFVVLFIGCCQLFVTVRGVHKRQTADCSYMEPVVSVRNNVRVEFCAITTQQFGLVGFGAFEQDFYVRVYDLSSNELIAERYSSGFHGSSVSGDVNFGEDNMTWIRGDGDGTGQMPFPPTWWMRFTAKLP